MKLKRDARLMNPHVAHCRCSAWPFESTSLHAIALAMNRGQSDVNAACAWGSDKMMQRASCKTMSKATKYLCTICVWPFSIFSDSFHQAPQYANQYRTGSMKVAPCAGGGGSSGNSGSKNLQMKQCNQDWKIINIGMFKSRRWSRSCVGPLPMCLPQRDSSPLHILLALPREAPPQCPPSQTFAAEQRPFLLGLLRPTGF